MLLKKNYLEILLSQHVLREFLEKSGTHVEVEVCEAVDLRLVGVPQSDGAAERNLSHQQVVHPAERELEKLNLLVVQVCVQGGCNTQKLN